MAHNMYKKINGELVKVSGSPDVDTSNFATKTELGTKADANALDSKADLSGATFTGDITVPKIVLESGWELY